MRISDWSSDVCSSDLVQPRRLYLQTVELRGRYRQWSLGEDHEVRPHPGRQLADLLFVEARIRRVRGEAAQRLGDAQALVGQPAARRLTVAILPRHRGIQAQARIGRFDREIRAQRQV